MKCTTLPHSALGYRPPAPETIVPFLQNSLAGTQKRSEELVPGSGTISGARSVAYVEACSETLIAGGRFHEKCRHALGFRQITPTCLPTVSKAVNTLSNCSSVWVAI